MQINSNSSKQSNSEQYSRD